MNTFNETWATFIPTKKERRIQAFKDALSFAWEVFLHLAFIVVVCTLSIIGLSI